jgi:predicted acyltransferase
MESTAPKRLISLDVLRGITIAFMIMVNNNGGEGSWWFMKHAQWNGMTPTDLVFPTFLFVVGVSLVFSFEARLAKGATRLELAQHTFERAFVLFLLGFVVSGFPLFWLNTMSAHQVSCVLAGPLAVVVAGVGWVLWRRRADTSRTGGDLWRVFFVAFFVFIVGSAQGTNLRIYGVLQRIALVYLIVGLCYLANRQAWTKVVALAVVLVGYWALVRWYPIPGVGVPGRDVPFLDMKQNLVSWIDRGLLSGHLYLNWDGPEAHMVSDPEGLLSTLPAVGTALMGMLAAQWLRTGRSVSAKAKGLGVAAVVSLILGYGWSLEFPLNKNMWTSSFVLVAAGWSLTVLTLAYWFVEKWGWGKQKARWAVYPWLVFGSNAIAVYVFSELLPAVVYIPFLHSGGKPTTVAEWLFRPVYAGVSDAGLAAMIFSVCYCAFCFIPVLILYRKKIFIKV